MFERRICAVVVTYNRSKMFLECLEALKSQTCKPDGIMVIDNCSTDNTYEMLVNYKYVHNCNPDELRNLFKVKTKIAIPDKNEEIDFYYFRLAVNTGGAGGFYNGVKECYDEGFDWICLRDDDVAPNPDCLEQLASKIRDEVLIYQPMRIGNGFKYKDCAVVDYDLKKLRKIGVRRKRKELIDEKITDCIKIQDIVFEGPLISRRLVDKIGFLNGEFFIIGDDTDYAIRASKYTTIFYVPTAKLIKKIEPEVCLTTNWKHYYSYRNMTYLERKYGENLRVRYLRPILHYMEMVVSSILHLNFKNVYVFYAGFFRWFHNEAWKNS